MKITIEDRVTDKGIDINAEERDGKSVDFLKILKLLNYAINRTINQLEQLRQEAMGEKKVVLPNQQGVKKFGN